MRHLTLSSTAPLYLSTLSIATGIIIAVYKPFIAKISDITSRSYTYILVLGFSVVGYIIAASCQSIAAYVDGDCLVAIGTSGLDFVNDIIVRRLDTTGMAWLCWLYAFHSIHHRYLVCRIDY
jgi:hypothetical protein